jgi:hypothetical protein
MAEVLVEAMAASAFLEAADSRAVVAVDEAAVAGAAAKPMSTARKSWSRSRVKLAVACSRSAASRISLPSIPRLPKSSEYRLGYSPDAASSAEGYHHVDLTIPKDKKLIIQTRDGYYSGK